jgi:hypothetical protein
MVKKIELTDEQKSIIKTLIIYKPMDYIATEAGCSKYKVRQYLKEEYQRIMDKIRKGEWEDL